MFLAFRLVGFTTGFHLAAEAGLPSHSVNNFWLFLGMARTVQQSPDLQRQEKRFGHRAFDFCLLSEKVKTSHAFWRNHISSQWNILQFFLAMGLHPKIWCVSPRQSCSEVLKGAWFLDPLTLNIFAVYLWLFWMQTVEFTEPDQSWSMLKRNQGQNKNQVGLCTGRLKQGCNNGPNLNIHYLVHRIALIQIWAKRPGLSWIPSNCKNNSNLSWREKQEGQLQKRDDRLRHVNSVSQPHMNFALSVAWTSCSWNLRQRT